jgi:Holliday junction resolvase RusA-like endonuclease
VAAELGPAWTPLGGPVALAVVVYVPMPASIPKRERLTARPERRPDIDNYVKTAMDGLSPLWHDDAQVVELHAEKRFAVDQPPRWEIAVESLTQPVSGAVVCAAAVPNRIHTTENLCT